MVPKRVEASVEELYGDTKEPDWKEIEVQRLKEEQGIILLPSVKMEGDMND